jgi:hypothetical protein
MGWAKREKPSKYAQKYAGKNQKRAPGLCQPKAQMLKTPKASDNASRTHGHGRFT